MGVCIAAHMAAAGSTITLDNHAVVDHGREEPRREAADMDLRHLVVTAIESKTIRVCWISGHREASSTQDTQELDAIRRNNEGDSLTKLATSLPLPLHNPTWPSTISVGGTETPSPTSKWIAATGPYQTYQGLHWSTLLPLQAQRKKSGLSGCGEMCARWDLPPLGKR